MIIIFIYCSNKNLINCKFRIKIKRRFFKFYFIDYCYLCKYFEKKLYFKNVYKIKNEYY